MNVNKALFLALLIVLPIHALHFLIQGVPFSTDVWPLIHASEKLVENPRVKIWIDKEFDGYNNHWPGVILSAAMVSMVTGLSIEVVYSLCLTTILCLAVSTLLYSYVSRFDHEYAWISVLVFCCVPSLTIFTSTTLKEVYCYPIVFTILLLPLISSIRRALVLVPLLSVAASLSHHLATLVAIASALNIGVLAIRDDVLGRGKFLNLGVKHLVIGMIMLSVFTVYYLVYGCIGFRVTILLNDLITLVLYAIAIHTILTLVSIRRTNSMDSIRVTALLAAIVLLLLSIKLNIVYGLRIPELNALAPYALPIVLLLIPRIRYVTFLARGITATVIIFASFATFAKPVLSNALHRILNYLAYSFSTTIYDVRSTSRKILVYTVLTLCILTTISIQLSIDLGLDKISFYWLYTKEDVALSNVLRNFVDSNVEVLGGAKLEYVLIPFIRVGITNTIKSLLHGKLEENEVLLLSRQSVEKGLVIGLNTYETPSWRTLDRECSLIVSSSNWHGYVGACIWS